MQIASTRLQALHRYWQDKRVDHALPARADIEPLEIPQHLPTLLLIDVETGPAAGGAAGPETGGLRLRVRLAGTEIVEHYGADYTGRYLDEIEFGEQRPLVLGDFAECVLTAEPNVRERLFWNPRGIRLRMERLILPLAADGRTVDMLMAGLAFQPLGQGEGGANAAAG